MNNLARELAMTEKRHETPTAKPSSGVTGYVAWLAEGKLECGRIVYLQTFVDPVEVKDFPTFIFTANYADHFDKKEEAEQAIKRHHLDGFAAVDHWFDEAT